MFASLSWNLSTRAGETLVESRGDEAAQLLYVILKECLDVAVPLQDVHHLEAVTDVTEKDHVTLVAHTADV